MKLEKLEYFDISPVVSAQTAVFPGDQSFERQTMLDFSKGDALALSRITTTVHIGAHVDAPNHYHPGGEGIDSRRLEYYLGKCQVISVSLPRGERIRPQHLGMNEIRAPRVILKTGSFPDPDRWNGDFNSLSSDLVEYLAARGVFLVGIDTPSIDPAADSKLESHQAVYRNDMAILEGIVLEGVRDGVYRLIALPLRLKGADASPVRAILVPEDRD